MAVSERTNARMPALHLPQPYLLFLGDVQDAAYAKTALGLRDWIAERCVGECALDGAAVTAGLPRLTPAEGFARGARALVIGVAPVGGQLSQTWIALLIEALGSGLDLISGMHGELGDNVQLREAAERYGRRLIDVRVPPPDIPVATGRKRRGKRLLTVGTDCALGKKYTALALTRALKARGVTADFRATGQTGILIAGAGIPIDAVIADFVAGAAEILTPDASDDHWDVVEGQGSLFHPSYGGVSLALLHGTQPDVIVVCHDPTRTCVGSLPAFALPTIEETIDLTLALARRTNPAVRCAGVAMNTSLLSEAQARRLMQLQAMELAMPVADPMRGGPEFDRLVTAILNGPAPAQCSLEVAHQQRSPAIDQPD